MKLPRRRFLRLATGAAALPAVSRIAIAQAYPTHPIKIIVPYAAGGPTDVLARIIGEHLRVSLGQPVIIENVPGATGTIAVGRVIQSPPDGYTLGSGTLSTHVFNGALFALKYDLLQDLEPIALLPSGPFIVVSKTVAPATNLKELIAWVKANPGRISLGHPGVGSTPHVAALQFAEMIGGNVQPVPYRGAGPALQDLITGEIDLMFGQPSIVLEQMQARTIRGYAVTAPTRLASAADIPTVDEAGLPGFYAGTWNGLWAPKGTPKDILAKLNAAIVNAMTDQTSAKRFIELGLNIPVPKQQTPEALRAYQRAEIEKWWPIIKAANIKVQ